MFIQSEQEALYVACQMERTAVQLYERALRVLQSQGRENDRLYYQLSFMHSDEQEHLRQFSALYQGLDATQEQRLALAAVAEGVLFEGGLMGAARQGLLDDVPSMLRFAIDAETLSAKKYREFAALTADEGARSALLLIAAEEDKHNRDLHAQAELLNP